MPCIGPHRVTDPAKGDADRLMSETDAQNRDMWSESSLHDLDASIPLRAVAGALAR